MLDHAREAVAMIEGKVRDDLRRERMLELSLVHFISFYYPLIPLQHHPDRLAHSRLCHLE